MGRRGSEPELDHRWLQPQSLMYMACLLDMAAVIVSIVDGPLEQGGYPVLGLVFNAGMLAVILIAESRERTVQRYMLLLLSLLGLRSGFAHPNLLIVLLNATEVALVGPLVFREILRFRSRSR